jgi:hypothetical protein
MALNKIDVLSLGRGSLKDNSNSIIAFSSNSEVQTWSNTTTYAQYNVVEHSSKIYRSKVASNLSNTPDASPNQWETLYSDPKDGDICFVINGANSNIMQRANSVWVKYRETKIQITLNDGQILPAAIFTYIGSTNYFSTLEYTIKRGAGHNRKRAGTMKILNDGSSDVAYDHEFTEIGDDVDTWITPVISGGTVQLQYTSGFEGSSIQLEYKLTGWQ